MLLYYYYIILWCVLCVVLFVVHTDRTPHRILTLSLTLQLPPPFSWTKKGAPPARIGERHLLAGHVQLSCRWQGKKRKERLLRKG